MNTGYTRTIIFRQQYLFTGKPILKFCLGIFKDFELKQAVRCDVGTNIFHNNHLSLQS